MVYGCFGALASLSAGCLPAGSTAAGRALGHTRFPYVVAYDDQKKQSVLGDDWRLENYRVRQTLADGQVEIERKDGYESTYEFDFDDDDKGDAKDEFPEPDLLLIHRKTNARIEVTTLLLDRRLADKELRVLLTNIVENSSGTRALFVGLGRVAVGAAKRFASRLLDSNEATLGNEKGLVATIERADLDQLELNSKARWGRSRMFLMHAPFEHYVPEPQVLVGSVAPGAAAAPTKFHKYRVLLLVEYTNNPEDFEAQYPDFVRLLNKIHVLTDDMFLQYLAEQLARCADKDTTKASVSVRISAVGELSLAKEEGLQSTCASQVLEPYRFAATGEVHTAEASYDFSAPLEPKWLTTGGFVEQRSSPETTAPVTTPDAPGAAAPSTGAPEPPAAPAPPATSPPPPGPEAAPGTAPTPPPNPQP